MGAGVVSPAPAPAPGARGPAPPAARVDPNWHSAPRRRVRARAVPSPRLRAGTVAHCSPGHPGRRSALGAWRGPAAICMRSSHKGSRSGARGGRAPPGPGAILRPGGGNSSPPAPGPPLRVNGRAPPPSEALCVSARPAGPAGDVPARPAEPPRQRPSPMLISLAARPGGRPRWEPPAFPARSPPASSCCREAPRSHARGPPRRTLRQVPSISFHSTPPARSTPYPCGKGRATVRGVAGQGAEGGPGPCPCSDPFWCHLEHPLWASVSLEPWARLPWMVSRGPSGPGQVFQQVRGNGVVGQPCPRIWALQQPSHPGSLAAAWGRCPFLKSEISRGLTLWL